MKKYLEFYAEKEIRLAKHIEAPYDTAVVLPACGEWPEIFPCLEALAKAASFSKKKVLCIVVVNGRATLRQEYISHNEALLNFSRSKGKAIKDDPPSYFLGDTEPQCLVIDRAFSFSEKEGVGHARKIGADLAVQLKFLGLLRDDYFHTTDADARVSTNYFELPTESAVYVHPFRHLLEPKEEHLSHILYEIWVRDYTAGLSSACSPYSFLPLGSLLSVPFNVYVKARGFPKRNAAEDFYFLNKVSKIARVKEGGGIVDIQPRESSRTPFGTGPGVKKIDDLLRVGKEPTYSETKAYGWLKVLLESSHRYLEDKDEERFRGYLRSTRENGQTLENIAERIGILGILREAFETRPELPPRRKHFDDAFDALKTLKFIHLLRDDVFPDLTFSDRFGPLSIDKSWATLMDFRGARHLSGARHLI